ncbi:hypothetical protein BGX28_002387 [Mortierella sp. GBA30]|nr:hypothetical protein BGX28_002387 [Mortierella sp. GBA30]
MSNWKLKTISEMMPDKFYDFIGEVCYLQESLQNRAVLLMTDYTENELLPYQEGKGARPKGKYSVLVTLWDEHYETFLKLRIEPGDVLLLKNLRCKIDSRKIFQLAMNGYKGKGYQQMDPIQVLRPGDPRAKEFRIRKAQYEIDQFNKEGVAVSGVSPGPSSASRRSVSPPSTIAIASITSPIVGGNDILPWTDISASVATTLPALHPAATASSSVLEGSSSSTATKAIGTIETHIPATENITRASTLIGASSSGSRALSAALHEQPKAESESPKKPSVPKIKRSPSSMEESLGPIQEDLGPGDLEAQCSPTRILRDRLMGEIRKGKRDAVNNKKMDPATSTHYCTMSAFVERFEPPLILNFVKAECQNCAHKFDPQPGKKKQACPRCKMQIIKYKYEFVLQLRDEFGQAYEVQVESEGAQSLLGTDHDPRLLKPGDKWLGRLKEKLARIGIIEKEDENSGSTSSLHQQEPIWFDCCLRLSGVQLEAPKAETIPEEQEYGYASQEDMLTPTSQPFSQMPSDPYPPPHTQAWEDSSSLELSTQAPEIAQAARKQNESANKKKRKSREGHVYFELDEPPPHLRRCLVYTAIN